MLPHGRSLVERYGKRPFVLLGVSAEPTREGLKALQDKEHLPWRSWWDEHGDIATRWGVEGFPTLFLIDRHGVVRRQWYGRPDPDQLDKKIEELVREAEGPTSQVRFSSLTGRNVRLESLTYGPAGGKKERGPVGGRGRTYREEPKLPAHMGATSVLPADLRGPVVIPFRKAG